MLVYENRLTCKCNRYVHTSVHMSSYMSLSHIKHTNAWCVFSCGSVSSFVLGLGPVWAHVKTEEARDWLCSQRKKEKPQDQRMLGCVFFFFTQLQRSSQRVVKPCGAAYMMKKKEQSPHVLYMCEYSVCRYIYADV